MRQMGIIFIIPTALEGISSNAQGIAHYASFHAAGPIKVDGNLDEPFWKMAPKSNTFIDIVTGKPPWLETHVAILWDDT